MTKALAAEAPIVEVTGSIRTHDVFVRVEPPIEDVAIYELCMRALHGDTLDPRHADETSLDAANQIVENATVLRAPQAEMMWEMWSMRSKVVKLLEGIGFDVAN